MASQKIFNLYVKILQKGHVICEESFLLVGKRRLKMTSRMGEPLSIPFYPFSQDVDFLQLRRGQAEVNVSSLFEGFLLSSGKHIDLNTSEARDRSFTLTPNDYASLVLGDLRILLKVALPPRQKTVRYDSSYKASLLSLFIKERSESIALSVAVVISAFLFLCFVAGMNIRQDDTPKNFESLEESYNLPFIAGGNLETIPEALKENLDREHYIVSVVSFYRSLTYLFLGQTGYDPRYHYSSSLSLYKSRFDTQRDTVTRHVEEKKESDILVEQSTGRILIPSIYGETFQQKILRIISKIESIQDGYKKILENRRKTTEEFRLDPGYDWGEYVIKNEHRSVGAIAKVKVFDQLTNEQAMYHEAKELSTKATYYRNIQEKNLNDKNWLQYGNTTVIILDPSLEAFSFINRPNQIAASEKKLEGVRASTYGEKEKLSQSPVVGKIEPERIAGMIAQHKFHVNLCYQVALRKNHRLQGELGLLWLVDTEGKSLDIKAIKDTVSDSRMLECVKSKISSWQFPKPTQGSVRISHTFHFEPKHG